MAKNICAAIVMAAFALTPLTHAEGERHPLRGAQCWGGFPKFRCDYIGDVTIKEIYEKGWRVIATAEQQHVLYLIIEEQEK